MPFTLAVDFALVPVGTEFLPFDERDVPFEACLTGLWDAVFPLGEQKCEHVGNVLFAHLVQLVDETTFLGLLNRLRSFAFFVFGGLVFNEDIIILSV